VEPPILVSACLLGMGTRYDGGSAASSAVIALCGSRPFLPVCPEQLGGLPTPREPAAPDGGAGAEVLAGKARVRGRRTGTDVTEAFLRGAREAAELARRFGVRTAYLKSDSPSCGAGRSHRLQGLAEGDGVLAALLRSLGIEVISVDRDPAP